MRSQKEKPVVNIFWMRRDLRLDDNTALFHALKTRENVLPLFIFDPMMLARISNGADYRINFVYESLIRIKNELEKIGSTLYVVHGHPMEVFKSLIEKYHVCSVYCNRNYEPYANHRDMEVERFLRINRTEFITYKDHVIFEKEELVKKDGKPYTVFTPYKIRYLEKLNLDAVRANKTSLYFHNFIRMKPLAMPTLDSMGFSRIEIAYPGKSLPLSLLENYEKNRDFPARDGTSKLSIQLRYGTVSIRKITALAMLHSQTFLSELIWRNFYSQILWFFPQVSTRAFKPAYDYIRWENDQNQFQSWCDGMTGYPLVDAGMRELNQTGFMHNRVRMVTASFLCKHLLIDWRWGETYFASKLNDYDLASNNGSWQWASGSGCDAVPYFRIFNPVLQAKRFDPDFSYIKKWVPEFGTDQYPAAMIDHAFARDRAIARYKEGLGSVG